MSSPQEWRRRAETLKRRGVIKNIPGARVFASCASIDLDPTLPSLITAKKLHNAWTEFAGKPSTEAEHPYDRDRRVADDAPECVEEPIEMARAAKPSQSPPLQDMSALFVGATSPEQIQARVFAAARQNNDLPTAAQAVQALKNANSLGSAAAAINFALRADK